MAIPTTKDGKNEIVFPQDFIQNHGICIRGAFEGRRLWEIIKLLDNPEKLEEWNAKYPTFLKQYGSDFDNGSESLFKEMSTPATARISGDKKIERNRNKIKVGDSFIEPYIPMSHFISPEGKLFRWYSEFLNYDSINNRSNWTISYLVEYHQKVPEIKQFSHILDYTNLLKLKENTAKLSSLDDLANDAENIKFFRDVSRCLVLAAKVKSLWTLDNPSRSYSGFHDYSPEERVYASDSLKRKVAKSGYDPKLRDNLQNKYKNYNFLHL